MAFDAFLKIEGIDDIDATSNIQIESFSWGATNTPVESGGGGGAGKVNVHDISITKRCDASSPSLMLACCTGQHIRNATITCRKAGKTEEYYVIKLEECLVSSYQTGGNRHGEPVPSEQLSLNFSKIYYNCSGKSAGYDVKNATKI